MIRSQAALGEFPIETTPMRLTPQGAVRHSGYLQVLSEGAVALEITNPVGLIQMAPGEPPAGVRQIFLYRFPSAQHSYTVSASQILPELAVSQTTIYQMTETDRVITGRIELDITKAPLREWSLRIPENYSVGNISGAVSRRLHPLDRGRGRHTRTQSALLAGGRRPPTDRISSRAQHRRLRGRMGAPAAGFP